MLRARRKHAVELNSRISSVFKISEFRGAGVKKFKQDFWVTGSCGCRLIADLLIVGYCGPKWNLDRLFELLLMAGLARLHYSKKRRFARRRICALTAAIWPSNWASLSVVTPMSFDRVNADLP